MYSTKINTTTVQPDNDNFTQFGGHSSKVNYPHLRPKSLKWELATHAQWIGAALGTIEKL
ncbi:hypothetical protein [Schleiferilactobacillus perolens]|uniref:hypothetical protein n=1 Tax=Schleiferilactobacillus perolens TaxID=100468 RepID=UPI0012EEDEC7|nr:hypothetical protein [Schleiferilactobacillus perolens]